MNYLHNILNIEDYTVFMRYLALGHTIVVPNTVSDYELSMDSDYNIEAINLGFNEIKYMYLDTEELVKELAPNDYTKELTIYNVLYNIIPKLKLEEPLNEYSFDYNNRWCEIKYTTREEIKNKILKTVGIDEYTTQEDSNLRILKALGLEDYLHHNT